MSGSPEATQQRNSVKRARKPGRKPGGVPWAKDRAIELVENGASYKEAGRAVGVHHNTIGLYLQNIEKEKCSLGAFKDTLGDTMKIALGKMSAIEDKLLDIFAGKDILQGMTSNERVSLYGRLGVSKGIIFDKLRLHEGKSTSNNSHEIQLKQAHASLPFPSTSSGE